MVAAVTVQRDNFRPPYGCTFSAAEYSQFRIQTSRFIYHLQGAAAGALRFLGEIHYAEVYRAAGWGRGDVCGRVCVYFSVTT